MRKKTFLYVFFAGLSVLLIAGFVLRQQFYGNAVKTERELFVSSGPITVRSSIPCCRS